MVFEVGMRIKTMGDFFSIAGRIVLNLLKTIFGLLVIFCCFSLMWDDCSPSEKLAATKSIFLIGALLLLALLDMWA